MLRARFPTRGAAARQFLDEAAITAQLQHPGIPPIHRIGALPDGRPFLAMKLIKSSFNRSVVLPVLGPKDGPTPVLFARRAGHGSRHGLGTAPTPGTTHRLKLHKGRTLEGPLKDRATPAEDRGRFLAIFEQVRQAVGYAHSVIHRDLKPANVTVGRFGEVQVLDLSQTEPVKDKRCGGMERTLPRGCGRAWGG